jgi:hypothetical protein
MLIYNEEFKIFEILFKQYDIFDVYISETPFSALSFAFKVMKNLYQIY